jgi:nucleotide-binding universal stress UspA family protein
LRSGRPVLIAPADVRPSALARIAVAWDGSSEAVRAVHDALRLLRLAQSVQIVEVSHASAEDTEIDCESLSAHLANHGIRVGTQVLQSRSSEEHVSLRRQIEEGQYDLVVMGAYSHPVWLEFIFGGATKSILLSSTTPILVSH